jgi:para-nitrobenzyl esterase
MRWPQVAQILFLAFFGFDAHAGEPIVHTQYGDVRGVLEGQVESFKNLPFAAPPTGELRWMPPEEPKKWPGIRDASHFSSKCPQTQPAPGHENLFVLVGNEDCLYLNVFKPSGARDLPVIVFIHGGALVSGSASETYPYPPVAVYDGSRLAEGAHVVVVTLNYRLGPFGFLSHKKLSAEARAAAIAAGLSVDSPSANRGSGNYGYMDQNQALQWVQHNIAAFGGDPQNVTLFGHSAGGTSVWVHISSPLSKGLFHRAIVDSGVEDEAEGLPDAEENGAKLSKWLHCSDPTTDELACMRGKSATAIFNALPDFGRANNDQYGPVVDNFVLTASPIKIMRNGMHNHVPIIQGNNEDEMSEIKDKDPVSGKLELDQTGLDFVSAVKEYVADNIRGASLPDVIPDVINLYRAADHDGSFRKAYNAIESDKKYICTSRRVLRALSKSQPEFFVGRFFYTHTYSDGPRRYFGAAHGYELPFIFDTLHTMQFLPTAEEGTLVKVFQDTWAVFAKTGVPTLPSPLPSWKRYSPEEDNYLNFNTRISTGDHHSTPQCDYWDKLDDKSASTPN